MRWQGRRRSENVEDRRGAPRRLAMGGGLGTLLLVVLYLFLGGNPQQLVNLQPGGQQGGPAGVPRGAGIEQPDDPRAEFAKVVLADTEDVWNMLLAKQGRDYREPRLVLFSGEVDSACGFAQAAVGPFYCPADDRVYLDLEFFDELGTRFQAPGDFAQAYVIAHEVGHHVQNLMGTTSRVHGMRERLGEAEYNDLSVRLELQADFYAGVWAHHAQRLHDILEEGDIEEALGAATAIGDDRLQMEARGYVVPESFTHGTSQQRVRWFTRGFKTGDPSQGDTFGAREL